jgi:hypothetical protein
MTKARYVERGGEQTYAAPFRQAGTKLRGWPLAADPGALQAVVDKYLVAPTGGALSYRAMFPAVLLAHAPIGSTRSLTPPDDGYGWTSETDLAFWMLVGRGHQDGPRWVVDQLLWFLPYVWVNVPQTMATGREVYGYPKEVATMETAASTGDPTLVVRASTTVLPVYTRATELVTKPVLEIRVAAWAERPTVLDTVRELGAAFRGVGHALEHLGLEAIEHPDMDVSVAKVLERDLSALEVPMVFLKQFRDVVEASAACYQAILESPARVEGLPFGFPLLDPATITVWDYASHPIATELGLGTPTNGKLVLEAPVGMEVHFDFVVELAKEMWRAG